MQTAQNCSARRRLLTSVQRGFTLMELMLVVALVGVMLGIAVPNFREFIRNNRLTSGANDLLAALTMARTEAVKRQTPVAVCATADANAATPVCSGAWSQGASSGWVVWVDDNDNWAPDNDADEPVLLRHESLHPSVKLLSNNNGIVKYRLSGFAAASVPGFINTSVVAMCDERGHAAVGSTSLARAVLITQTGRTRVTKLKSEIDAINGIDAACPQE